MSKKRLLFLVAILAVFLIPQLFLDYGFIFNSRVVQTSSPAVISLPAFPEGFDSAAAMTELFETHQDKQRLPLEDGRARTIKDILASNMIQAEKTVQLAAHHVYVLAVPEEDIPSQGDIIIPRPVVYLDAVTGYWLVSASGAWQNRSWDSRSLWFKLALWPFRNRSVPVGGHDIYGITLYNTSDNYYAEGIYLDSSGCLITDQNWTQTVESSSRSTASAKDGIAFIMQDQAVVTKSGLPGFFRYEYLGHNFTVFACYSPEFRNYQWNAVAFGHSTGRGHGVLNAQLDLQEQPYGVQIETYGPKWEFFAFLRKKAK